MRLKALKGLKDGVKVETIAGSGVEPPRKLGLMTKTLFLQAHVLAIRL